MPPLARALVPSLSAALALALGACGDAPGPASAPASATDTDPASSSGAASGDPGTTSAASSGPAPTSTEGATETTAATLTGATTTTTGDTGGPPAGFWHLEPPRATKRHWLVSPGGERVFMLGVNTVMRAKQCDGIEDWITRHPPTKSARIEWARLSTGQCEGESVPAPYCFNSVGAFSDTNDFDGSGGDSYMIRPVAQGGAGAPYTVVVSVDPKGDDRSLRDASGEVLHGGISGAAVGDPYNPAFLADLDAMVAADIVPRRDDPDLQIWYLGNEIGVFDKGGKSGSGVRDFRRWLWSDCPPDSTLDAPRCAPHALAASASMSARSPPASARPTPTT